MVTGHCAVVTVFCVVQFVSIKRQFDLQVRGDPTPRRSVLAWFPLYRRRWAADRTGGGKQPPSAPSGRNYRANLHVNVLFILLVVFTHTFILLHRTMRRYPNSDTETVTRVSQTLGLPGTVGHLRKVTLMWLSRSFTPHRSSFQT